MAEEALQFACEGEELVGILHRPVDEAPAVDLGVVVIVGGPQYRAGSHRQFVQLARAIAGAGYPVLRFDMRGMGDGSGTPITFEQASADVAAAIETLIEAVPATRRVVLWGLCDGASAALLYIDERRDPRVAGLCLANPWVRSPDSHARTTLRHYYTRRVLQPEFWGKLLRGRVSAESLHEVGSHVRTALARKVTSPQSSYQQRMLRGLEEFEGRVLLVVSGLDYTAQEFVGMANADRPWRAALRQRGVVRSALPDADHTFSRPEDQAAIEATTRRWLGSLVDSASRRPVAKGHGGSLR